MSTAVSTNTEKGKKSKEMIRMQTKLVDERWYDVPKTMDEAKGLINTLLGRLEEAEKMINKPDYELVKRIEAIKVAPESQAVLDEILADIKAHPISDKGVRKSALWVLPHKNGNPVRSQAKLLTYQLNRKAQLQKHCDKGTQPKSETTHRTCFPSDLIDDDRTNATWKFKPTKVEIIEK